MRRIQWLLLACAGLLVNSNVSGQIDPDRREYLEAGFNQALQGADPFSGYGYYYINEPNFFGTNITFRMALAPVYADTETGFVGLLGPNTDLGLGMAGGGFADNYYEFRQGKYYQDESFYGHVIQPSVSIYHLFNPGDRIPLNGVLRITDHYSVYARDDETTSKFVLPPDHSTMAFRAGLRWGGRPPELHPNMAMELSAWYENDYRTSSGGYGFDGDRVLNRDVQLFWARGLLTYTFPKSKQSFDVSLTAGGSVDSDRFSAYRAGGNLPLASEFPLTIPGYFDDELSARNFVLFSAQYSIPIDPAKQWSLRPMASAATMEYVPGLQQKGHFNSGAGMGLNYQSKNGRWDVLIDYGYGFEAVRDDGRGGQSVGILLHINLGVNHPNGPSHFDNAIDFLRNHL
jgi:hypothetical protein